MKILNHNASGQDIYGRTQSGKAKPARDLCGRCEWVGADGLVVAPPKFNAIDWINFWWEFYTSAADMCGNGSRAACMYAYEILAVQSVKFLGDAGAIDGEIFRIFCRNFSESVRDELHNEGFCEILHALALTR